MRFTLNNKKKRSDDNSKFHSELGKKLANVSLLQPHEADLIFDSVPRLDNNLLSELDRLNYRILYGAGRLGVFSAELLPGFFNVVTDQSSESLKKFPQNIIESRLSFQDLNINLRDAACFIAITKVRLSPLISMLRSIGLHPSYHVYELLKLKTSGKFNNSWYYESGFSNIFSNIQEIVSILEDENSRRHYISFLNWHLESLDSYDLLSSPYISNEYAVDYFQGLPNLDLSESTNEITILDGGSSDSSFIKNVQSYYPSKKKIFYQFDPRKESSSSETIARYSDELVKRYKFETALSNNSGCAPFDSTLGMASRLTEQGIEMVTTTKLDDLDIKFDIVKLHLEGGELMALNGSIETLKKEPKLVLITVYHNEEGIFEIQRLLYSILGSRYRYYFHNHGYSGVASIFKAVRKL